MTDFGLAALHSSITLWYRLPMLAAAPSAAQRAEIGRMVSEKAGAMIEGAVNAQAEAFRLGASIANGTWNPADAAHAPLAITAAALEPAFRRVRSNSRRLRRRHGG